MIKLRDLVDIFTPALVIVAVPLMFLGFITIVQVVVQLIIT